MKHLLLLLTMIIPGVCCADDPRDSGADEVVTTEWLEDESNFYTPKIWILTLIDVDGKSIDLDYGEHDRRHSLWTRERCMEQGIYKMKWALYYHKHPEETELKYIQYLGFDCHEEEQLPTGDVIKKRIK